MYNKDLSTMEALEGPVQFAHQFVDMPEYNVQVKKILKLTVWFILVTFYFMTI